MRFAIVVGAVASVATIVGLVNHHKFVAALDSAAPAIGWVSLGIAVVGTASAFGTGIVEVPTDDGVIKTVAALVWALWLPVGQVCVFIWFGSRVLGWVSIGLFAICVAIGAILYAARGRVAEDARSDA